MISKFILRSVLISLLVTVFFSVEETSNLLSQSETDYGRIVDIEWEDNNTLIVTYGRGAIIRKIVSNNLSSVLFTINNLIINNTDLSSNRDLLVATRNSGIHIYNLDTLQHQVTLVPSSITNVASSTWSYDGSRLIITGSEGIGGTSAPYTEIWDTASWQLINAFQSGGNSVKWVPNQNQALITRSALPSIVMNTTSGAAVELTDNNASASSINLAGTIIATSNATGIFLYDAITLEEIDIFSIETTILDLAWNDRGTYLALASLLPVGPQLLDVSQNLIYSDFLELDSATITVWSPDGSRVAYALDAFDEFHTVLLCEVVQCPIASPSNVSATYTSSAIDLDWADNATDETAFHIERAPDDGTGRAPTFRYLTRPTFHR